MKETDAPDVVSLPLEKAEEALREAHWEYEVRTVPPAYGKEDGGTTLKAYVVRQQLLPQHKAVITVMYKKRREVH
ncbi:MAG: hypothetical protein I3I94_06870 [Acidaminococcaceae bacterium]|uniref:hypothetical protein n=1 Tax=Dialister sp. UBA1703 TaxID=1946415 RepID=UPI0025BEEBAF|nr:hypothetical protein [Dialister sp. UBA1703]MBM6985827.1 hypothetical protein [Acidaminococcaceae bacterium]